MGYISTVHGEWTITPPLNARELRAIPYVECVAIRREESERETDEGVLTVMQGVAVEPAISEGKVYELHNHLQQVLNAISGDHKVTGEIVRVGERNGDVERFLPRPDGKVKAEQAHLSWPDGSEVKY